MKTKVDAVALNTMRGATESEIRFRPYKRKVYIT